MSRMICLCNRVTEKDIEKILSKYPHAQLQDVIKLTAASTSCGRCRTELESIVEQKKSEQNSASSQLTIPFDFSRQA